MKTLISTDVDFERDGYQAGTLRLPHSHDKSAYGHIPIPVAVLKNGVGPTLLLTGGNHGDEYEGPVALMKLFRRMRDMKINGRLIVIPALNFPAFLNGSRTSPIDHANLNRVFPGVRNGRLTEMIAHYMDTELFPIADVIFDIHSGGASMNHIPTLLASIPEQAEQRRQYIDLVETFDAPYVMVADLLGEDRTYGAAVLRHNKVFLCGEFGGFGTCNIDGVAIVEDGLLRLMRKIGLTEEDGPARRAVPARILKVEGEDHYVFAPCAGVFEPAFRLGDEIEAGALAGRIFDPYHPGAAPTEVYFKGRGTVMCIRTFAGVAAGDCLGHLAADAAYA